MQYPEQYISTLGPKRYRAGDAPGVVEVRYLAASKKKKNQKKTGCKQLLFSPYDFMHQIGFLSNEKSNCSQAGALLKQQ